MFTFLDYLLVRENFCTGKNRLIICFSINFRMYFFDLFKFFIHLFLYTKVETSYEKYKKKTLRSQAKNYYILYIHRFYICMYIFLLYSFFALLLLFSNTQYFLYIYLYIDFYTFHDFLQKDHV